MGKSMIKCYIAIELAICLYAPCAAWAVVAGQTDTFESGTTLNWQGGASPTNIPTGGPAGAGDHYLRISSNNSGLATFNNTQWSGDYLAAGVTAVAADFRNQSAVPLSIRLALFNSPGGEFTTTTAIPLPADNLWHHLIFGLSAADLTYVGGGTGQLEDTLSSVGRLFFGHRSGPPTGAGGSSPVTGVLNIDNITTVPEPTASALFLAACVATLRRPRMWRSSSRSIISV
jgi:hypothetical protein